MNARISGPVAADTFKAVLNLPAWASSVTKVAVGVTSARH